MAKKVLVVDDEPDLELLVRQHFRRKIRSGDMSFVFAHNGKLALEQLAEHRDIDVVMSDINMPEMDGLTLLNEIIKQYPLLRSVIVSAYGDMKNLRTAMNNGAYDFVTKPIDFDDLEKTLLKTILEVEQLKESNSMRDELVNVRKELQIGREIQLSFLPTSIHPVQGWDFAAHFQPAKEVAGDFYDIFPLAGENKVCFMLGDVCGKGVGSALFMTLCRSLLHAYAIMNENDPDITLKTVQMAHDYITTIHEDANMFATLFFGVLDTHTGEIEYVNCGHCSPVIYRLDGTQTELEPSGPVVGMFPSTDFELKKNVLTPGSLLFIYSDGATDCINPEQELFGEEKLIQFVQERIVESSEQILKNVIDAIAEFSREADQFDDITLMAIKYL
ncbi:MAG: SpoIIE family protein phosphatase [Ignavibacteriales bacterium]|nr:SpoIIE family protein phosphatase [Ignavibacteriales bacterium]